MRLENIAERITYCENDYETMDGSDAVVILTE
jgi:UDPglucose 6-dehydrogenase